MYCVNRRGSRERGFALAIVVWFLAAMSLLVAGIVSQARVDARLAQVHVARAQAVAAGDGAIQLMLLEQSASGVGAVPGDAPPGQEFTVGQHEVSVQLVPQSALVDLNMTDAPTLAQVLGEQAGNDSGEAQRIADNVVKWRSDSGGSLGQAAGNSQFAAIEDLLRVDGVGRTALDAMRDYITVSGGSSGQAAGSKILQALQDLYSKRNNGKNKPRVGGAGKSGGPAGGSTQGNQYRADALVTVGDQIWLRRRWVTMGGVGADSTLPWKFFRTEAPRVVSGEIRDSI